MRAERTCEVVEPRRVDREPGGGAVAAEALEMLRACREGTVTPKETSSFNEMPVIAAKWDGGGQIAT